MVTTLEMVNRRTDATRRGPFAASVKMLKVMGFLDWAIKYLQGVARGWHCLPHGLVVKKTEEGIWSQVQGRMKEPKAEDWTAKISHNENDEGEAKAWTAGSPFVRQVQGSG